jgi:glutaminyl-peptide cyclotransferase
MIGNIFQAAPTSLRRLALLLISSSLALLIVSCSPATPTTGSEPLSTGSTASATAAPHAEARSATPQASDVTPVGGEEQGAACPSGATDASGSDQPQLLRVDVRAELPHDPDAFTQGLLVYDGAFYESTGRYGRSEVRALETGTGQVMTRTLLGESEFGEGLARVGDQLVQITWREGVAHVYDLDTLEPTSDFTYDGEGWGICYDGSRLVMSDGSSQLTFRDPDTFEPIGQIEVTLEGTPVERLNELECVGDAVYANVWQTDRILKIDPGSGEVRAVVDASGLMPPERLTTSDVHNAVLNGIAFDEATGVFYLTGKLWPTVFEACLVPADVAP